MMIRDTIMLWRKNIWNNKKKKKMNLLTIQISTKAIPNKMNLLKEMNKNHRAKAVKVMKVKKVIRNKEIKAEDKMECMMDLEIDPKNNKLPKVQKVKVQIQEKV